MLSKLKSKIAETALGFIADNAPGANCSPCANKLAPVCPPPCSMRSPSPSPCQQKSLACGPCGNQQSNAVQFRSARSPMTPCSGLRNSFQQFNRQIRNSTNFNWLCMQAYRCFFVSCTDRCLVCKMPCSEPVESLCCHKFYCCRQCAPKIKTCPLCSCREYRYEPMPVEQPSTILKCPYCQFECTCNVEYMTHITNCEHVVIKCPDERCNQLIKRNEYYNHIIDRHFKTETNNTIANTYHESHHNASSSSSSSTTMTSTTTTNTSSSSSSSSSSSNTSTNHTNIRTHVASNGKHYCGERCETNCVCCNGLCGPSDGCNCAYCMELDIRVRGLPRGCLVNRDGIVSTRSIQTGMFYCGQSILDKNSDGFCGPFDGPNCFSCQMLDKMTSYGGPYAKFL